MADMRRRGPQPPPWGRPQVQFTPGLADQMLRELAPLLAEEGIDVDNIDIADLDTLQRALNRAVERRNMELFSPVGETRDIALVTLRLVVQAILDGDTTLAAALLDQVQPESPDNSTATVASCIGIALGLLEDRLSSQKATRPPGSANTPRCPPDTGTANTPPPTSSPSPAKDERSARWTRCSPTTAAGMCSPAPPSPSQPPPTPGHNTPTHPAHS